MDVIIHRGTHSIGGSCIEIITCGHRLIIDAGIPLMDSDGLEIDEGKLNEPSIENGILPDVKGLYKDQTPSIDVVLISHSHLDHSGLVNHIHPSIPVFVSPGSLAMIEIGNVFYPDRMKIRFENYQTFLHWKPFQIGSFRVTSYLVDHSAYDASAFLIEANNKKVFYTGDFRGHGRKKVLFNEMIRNPVKNVDCMLMEGSTLKGGHSVGFESEEAVEKALHEIFKNQSDVSFIMASGSNIDRIVSIYKAAKAARKTLVIDLYTYFVLDKLKKITPNLPPFDNDHVRIFYLGDHFRKIKKTHKWWKILGEAKNRRIEVNEIAMNRENMIIKTPLGSMIRISEQLTKNNPFERSQFIFSMWQGYLDKCDKYQVFCDKYQIDLKKIHVSGHAYLDALKKMAQAIRPKKLVPIHTFSGDEFFKYFDNVVRVDDGISFSA